MGGGSFTPSQSAYQFYNDGTEAGAVAQGSQDTALSRNVSTNSNIQCRIRVQALSGFGAGGTYQLQASLNGGAFANVTAVSSIVKGYDSPSLTDGEPTTQRLTSGSGSFVAGSVVETGSSGVVIYPTGSNFSEILFSLTLIAADLAAADVVTFRTLYNAAVFTGGYAVTPTLNITKSSGSAARLALLGVG